jgi:hypothetical protein
VGIGASTEDVFAALERRGLRLRQDQQVEEWLGSRQRTIRAKQLTADRHPPIFGHIVIEHFGPISG